MSVDITRLTEHLSLPQQRAVRQAYRRHAQSETAALLWCFFLGIVGAHRFYLRQWRRAVWHVALFVALVAVIAAGITLGWSPAVTVASAVPLLLISLVWVVVDLFRIDDEVSRRNLALAEKLTSEALVADPARERMALDMLAAAEGLGVAQPDPVATGVSVSQDDLQAAEAAIATPETAGAGDGVASPDEDEIATPAGADPYRTDTGPVAVQTVTGIAGLAEGEGYRMIPPAEAEVEQAGDTPSITPKAVYEAEVPEAGTPSSWRASPAAAVEALDAATSAALAPSYRAGGEDSAPLPEWPTSEYSSPTGIGEHTPADDWAGDARLVDAGALATRASDTMWGDSSSVTPDPAVATAPVVVATAAAAAGILGLGDAPGATEVPSMNIADAADARDVTDLGDDGVRFAPISDIEPESAWRLLAASPAASDAQAGPRDAALLLVPESAPTESLPGWQATPAWPAPDTPSRPGAAAESPASDSPSDLAPVAAAVVAGDDVVAGADVLRDEAEPDAEIAAEAAADGDSLASSPPPATAMAATAAAEATSMPEPMAPSPAAETPRHRLKHIRVVRQVKVGDDVVEESVAEAYISPDEDPEPVRQRLREQLRREAEEQRQRDAR